MRVADHKAFLDRLQENPRQFENKNLLRDIILNNHPQLFFEALRIGRELIAENRLSADKLVTLFSVDVPLPGIFNRLMRDYKTETLIETVLKITIQKPETKPEAVKWRRRMLVTCFINSAPPNRSMLNKFLIYGSPELVTLFFAELKAARESSILASESYDDIFNAMIRSDFIHKTTKNNRISVLNGLKTMGYNLSSASSCIHTLAGSATISTANFFLEEGIDINSKDRNNHTTIWYIIENIKNMNKIIGTDYLFFQYRHDQFYSDYDLLTDRLESFTSQKRFMCDNINKTLFLLEKGAEMTTDEAKKLDSALTLCAGKYARNKSKYPEISFVKLQYLRGIVKEKLGEAQQASYHFIEAATQGDRAASLKLAEYYLLTRKEEDALIWYQQTIHNSATPKPTLLQLIGLEKMIQLAHGISLRKTETNEDLHKDYAFILRELKGVDYSKETISVDGLLQLAHLAVEPNASPKQYKLALQLTCAAYDKARSEEKPRLIQTAQQDIQHVMSRILDKLPTAEAKYHTGINFMPSPSECGIAHYYRLCLELAMLNLDLKFLKEDSEQRAPYWVEMAAILGHKDITTFSQNLREAIETELYNVTSVMPHFIDETSRDLHLRLEF